MLTKFASASVLDVVAVPAGANAKTLRKAAHRVGFKYEPRPGFIYIRSRAISSRCNDNFDEFPAEEIKQSYGSFIGKPVFVNHHNDNHRRARGVVIDAALHEDTNPDGTPDTWCEVLMEVDAVRFPKLAKAILAGHIDRTSMGTDVAFSVCSVCNNKATTPLEYCQHIPRMKGQRVYKTTASGKKIGVLVREKCYGLKFFENSLLVEEPADPTAYFLGVEAGPGVAGPKAVKVSHRKAAENTQYHHLVNYSPLSHEDQEEAVRNSQPKPLQDTMDEQYEREQNSDLQLTPGDHNNREFNPHWDSPIQSLNSIHAFFKRAELSPISDCKHCDAKKGTHCAIDCGGVRLYKHAAMTCHNCGEEKDTRAWLGQGAGPPTCRDCHHKELSSQNAPQSHHDEVDRQFSKQAEKVRFKSTEDAKAHVETHAAAQGHNMGSWTENNSGSHSAHCKDCGRSAGVDRDGDSGHMDYGTVTFAPCESKHNEAIGPQATEHAQMVLENDHNDYHNIQSIVNTSKHPAETSHALGQYMRSLPKSHPLHEDLRNLGATHDDVDTDAWAKALHDERALNPGDVHPPEGDFHMSRKTAIGETIAPGDVDTLRDEECPVCAEKDAYDGNECQVCGFIQPPKMFQDPDLDTAKQMDLRKDNIDGFDPRDPNSDPQGAGQVAQQPGDAPGAVDAQGMPNEVPGSDVPGSDQVPMGPDGQPIPGGAPLAPVAPQMLDQEGNPLPSQTGIPPVGLPAEGPMGVGNDSLAPPAIGPNGLPLEPGGIPDPHQMGQIPDPRQMGQGDISQMGQEPGLPILDGTDPQVQMQFGTGDSIQNLEAPPGVQGDVMPDTDIYGQPLGPDGPIPPEEVAQMQNPLDPSQIGPDGEPLASDGAPGGGTGEDGFAADGQPFDTAQSGDQTMTLACTFCGEEFEASPPTTITTDQPEGNTDGIQEGDVCPICGQGQLMAETEAPDESGGTGDPVADGGGQGGGDSLDNGEEKTPFGKNKLS